MSLTTWSADNPRTAGAIVAGFGFVLASINALTISSDGSYRRSFFPIAGACLGSGLFQLITGVRSHSGAPWSVRVPAIAMSLGGFALGFAVNVLVTGSVF